MVNVEYLDDIMAIHPKLFSKIRKAGTKTGSKVFGGWAEGSDIDFILPPGFSPDWNESMQRGIMAYTHDGEYHTNDFSSGYMKTDSGSVINLLFMNTEEAYQIWVKATDALKLLVDEFPSIAENMKNKRERVSLFEAIKESLK